MNIFHNTYSQLNTPIIGFRLPFFIRRTTAGVQSMYADARRTTLQFFRTTLQLIMCSLALRRTTLLVRRTTLQVLRTTLQLLMMYLQVCRTIFSYTKGFAQHRRTPFQLRRTTLRITRVFIDINKEHPLLFLNHLQVRFSFVETRLTLNSFGSASAIL